MRSNMPWSWLLFVLSALVALSASFSVEDALNIDGINAYLHHGVKRQAAGTGASSSAPAPATTNSPAPSSDDSTPTPTPSASPSESSEASPTSAGPTTEPTTETPATTTAQSVSSRTTARSGTPVVTTKPLVSTEIAPTTTIITVISNGQTMEQTSVGSRTVEHTTGSTTETTLSSVDDGSSSNGGLTDDKKKIIGGVVGGVGGAILLGGIAIVCWRMWGKKKRVSEDDADLVANTGAALGDKSHNNGSPFQSNLDQYHNPGGRPNAAANF